METIRDVIPLELFITLIVVSIISFIFGYKKVASFGLLLSLGPFLIPEIKRFLLAVVPWWIAVPLFLIFIIISIKALLSFLFGRNAADQAVGQISANFIQYLLAAPFRLIRTLKIHKLLAHSPKVLFSMASLSFPVINKGRVSLKKKREKNVNLDETYKIGDRVLGTVAEMNEKGFLIDLKGEYFGLIDNSCDLMNGEMLSRNQKIRLKDKVDAVVVRVRVNEKLVYLQGATE